MSAPSSRGTTTEKRQGVCPSCQAPILVDERFCEICGTNVAPDAAETTAAPVPEVGRRVELEAGAAAAVSDRGLRRRRNEDAVTMAAAGGGFAVALCDGVASTANAHHASERATAAALHSLEVAVHAGTAGVPSAEALSDVLAHAFADAQRAVCTVSNEDPHGKELSPSTTMVAALAFPGRIAVGSVGDSRAYWLTTSGAEQRLLTVDDSWAEELIAEGASAQDAYANPEAHTITRWLGPDAGSIEPTVTMVDVEEPGLLVLCSDGLWNYFNEPERLAALVDEAREQPSLTVARHVVDAALAEGGHDNVTVAVIPVPPAPPVSGPISEE